MPRIKARFAILFCATAGVLAGCDSTQQPMEPTYAAVGELSSMQEDSVSWDANGVLEASASDTVYRWERSGPTGEWDRVDHYKNGVFQGHLKLTYASGVVVRARYESVGGWWAETNADSTGIVVADNFEHGGCDPNTDPMCEYPEFGSFDCEIEQAFAESAMRDFESGIKLFGVAALIPVLTVPGSIAAIMGGLRAVRAIDAWGACLEYMT